MRAGGWGVCKGCYKKGYKGRTEECGDGFCLCRGCGVHVKASVGACKPCLKKERQADGNPVDAPAVGFVLCRGGCGAHVKASRAVCKPCAQVDSASPARDVCNSSPAAASGRCQEEYLRGGRCASGAYVFMCITPMDIMLTAVMCMVATWMVLSSLTLSRRWSPSRGAGITTWVGCY